MVKLAVYILNRISFKDILVYFFAVTMALLLYRVLNQNIETTLKPYVLAIHLIYQAQFEFIPDLGYKEAQGLFLIGRECLGGRLFICLFFILVICRLKACRVPICFPNICKELLHKLCTILCFCAISILLSYMITTIRIAASIPFCKMADFKLIHTILSLVIYFGSGLALYNSLMLPEPEKICGFSTRSKSKGGMEVGYK